MCSPTFTTIMWLECSFLLHSKIARKNTNNTSILQIINNETTPINGHDTIFEAMEFITSLGVNNFKCKHPRSEPVIWFKTNVHGVTTRVIWASICPSYGIWQQMLVTKFLTLHKWLTTNYYVWLGNRVWEWVLGIPMGFSCSPLWCNLYLMSYEMRFI